MANTKKTAAKADTTPMAMLMQMQQAGLGPLNWMGAGWAEALGTMSSEVTQFVADRIREDVRTQHAILHAKTPVEVQSIQAEFVQKAIEDYTAETGKLIEMSTRLFTPPKSGG